MAQQDLSMFARQQQFDLAGAIQAGRDLQKDKYTTQQKVDYDAAVKKYGAAAMAGDQTARNMLAQFDPTAMREWQIQDEELAIRKADSLTERQNAASKAAKDALDAASDAEKATIEKLGIAALGSGAFKSEEAFDAFVAQHGGDPGMISREDAVFLLPAELQVQAMDAMKGRVDPYTGVPETSVAELPSTVAPITSTDLADAGIGAPMTTPAPIAPAADTTPVTSVGVFLETNRTGTKAPAGSAWTMVDGKEVVVPLPGSEKDDTGKIEANVIQGTQLIGVIDELMTTPDDVLDNVLGTIGGGPREKGDGSLGDWADFFNGEVAQGNVAKIDQLRGSAFLIAAQLMKGSGALSDTEGKAATEAVARLSRAQSPEDFKIALKELRDTLTTGIRISTEVVNTRKKAYGQPALDATTPELPTAEKVPEASPPETQGFRAARLEELRKKKAGTP